MQGVATVAHPRIEPGEYQALQMRAGWRLDMELIDGEAVVMPPMGDWASSTQGELFLALSRWQEQSGDAGLIRQDVFVAFPGGQYLAPDISWWSAERRPSPSQGALDSTPDLVVEVLSPATRANDLGVKRDVYIRAGVREIWLADPEARTITRVCAGAGGDEVLDTGNTLRSELLDGFALDIGRVFRAL
jgi:Uma2 family endonuclease